jgi:predicted phosphoribosyltransferase
MAKKPAQPTAKDHLFSARFPEDVWAKLQESAEKNLRTINSELVYALRAYYSGVASISISEWLDMIQKEATARQKK